MSIEALASDSVSPPGLPESAPGGPPAHGADPAYQRWWRRRLTAEIWIVLGLSLGYSALRSVVSIVGKLTAGPPLAAQQAVLNAPQADRPYLDLAYQLLGIGFTLMPVLLALWLLSSYGRSGMRRIGFDAARPVRDLAVGVGLAALIGLPGLAFYAVGRQLGITADVIPTLLNAYWWTVPILILQAVKNAVLEEVVVVGYLVERLRTLGWGQWPITLVSSVLRGSYHLYQGFGPFIGNAVMGVVFAQYYQRKGRVMPLVVAHTILDIVSFVGYQLFAKAFHLN